MKPNKCIHITVATDIVMLMNKGAKAIEERKLKNITKKKDISGRNSLPVFVVKHFEQQSDRNMGFQSNINKKGCLPL